MSRVRGRDGRFAGSHCVLLYRNNSGFTDWHIHQSLPKFCEYYELQSLNRFKAVLADRLCSQRVNLLLQCIHVGKHISLGR